MLGKGSIFVRLCKARSFYVYMQQFDSNPVVYTSFCTRKSVRLLVTEPSKRHYTTEDGTSSRRPILVILGTGWGSYSVLKTIDKKRFDVIVVSPRNHFLFTPLLCSTTVGTLEFRSIIEPVRNTGFRNPSHFHQAEAIKLNPKDQTVTCRSTLENSKVYDISYDKLVIGVGALSNTFNVPGVKEHAFFLKEISDARAIRNRILSNFELALQPGTVSQRRKDCCTLSSLVEDPQV